MAKPTGNHISVIPPTAKFPHQFTVATFCGSVGTVNIARANGIQNAVHSRVHFISVPTAG